MKAFLRSAAVQKTAVWLISSYLKLCYLTLRWTREDQDKADAVRARHGESGVIVCFWHSRIPISPPCWPPGAQEPRALISNSSDGEFIAMIMEPVGFPAIRGSRQRTDSVGDKGGDKAYREMIRWVAKGNGIAITPDGPAGPVEVMGEGSVSLARLTKAPTLLVGLACSPCWRLKTWDQTIIPRPFARAAMVWDGPFQIGRDTDLTEAAADWGARLNAATARAEALLK